MKVCFSKSVVTCLTLVLFASMMTCMKASAQSQYYVSPSGGNYTGNGSMNSPWATIAFADKFAKAGDTIHVAAGVYYGSFDTLSTGSASAPVTFVADSADFSTPVNCSQIAADHGDLSTCVRLIGTTDETWVNHGDHVVIKGFDVTGGGMNGIATLGDSTTIIGNHIHDMVNNRCDSNGGSGINIDGTNAEIDGNYIHNIGPFPSACGYVQGIYFTKAGGAATNNISFANSGFGIQLWHFATEISLVNNTIFNNATGGIVLGTDDDFLVDYVTVSNNLVASNGGVGIAEQGVSLSVMGVHNVFSNNLVYANSGGGIALWNGLTALGTVAVAPNFIDYTGVASGDYHLNANSPAISGAGTAGPTTDFDGNARSLGGLHDIGAYQYVGANANAAGAAFTLSSSSLSFPSTSTGATSAVDFITLKNTGSANLLFNGNFGISGPFAFAGQGTCTRTVSPGSSCTISVVFRPVATGAMTGTITLSSNGGTRSVSLSGYGE